MVHLPLSGCHAPVDLTDLFDLNLSSTNLNVGRRVRPQMRGGWGVDLISGDTVLVVFNQVS